MIIWKTIKRPLGPNIENGYLNQIKVFQVWYDSLTPRGSAKKIALTHYLPGLQKGKRLFASEDEAKVEAENTLNNWLRLSGLERRHS